jgi:hypothetical protein
MKEGKIRTVGGEQHSAQITTVAGNSDSAAEDHVREKTRHEAADKSTTRSFTIRILHITHQGNQIKTDTMCGACSTHGENEKCIQNVGRKNLNKDRLREPGVFGRIMSKLILEKCGMTMKTLTVNTMSMF